MNSPSWFDVCQVNGRSIRRFCQIFCGLHRRPELYKNSDPFGPIVIHFAGDNLSGSGGTKDVGVKWKVHLGWPVQSFTGFLLFWPHCDSFRGGQFIWSRRYQRISMTSLLAHNVAHSTRHSFRPKTKNQPFNESFMQLSKSCQKFDIILEKKWFKNWSLQKMSIT